MPGTTFCTLSVVVAAWTGPEALARCLKGLRAQVRHGEDEVIVARNFAGAALGGDIRDLVFDPTTNVPQLRAAGLASATGQIVAFLEDHAVPVPGWRDALVGAFVPPVGAVGGPVDLAPGGSALDWAVFFYDYARFAPPLASGPVASLSGVNAAYRRDVLARLVSGLPNGLHEAELEARLHAKGVTMWLEGDAGVVVARRGEAYHAIGLAFSLARGYMGRRVSQAPVAYRCARVALAPFVPLLLFARLVRDVERSPHLRGRFLRAAGWVLLLQIAWGAGEAIGALAGVGRADERWR